MYILLQAPHNLFFFFLITCASNHVLLNHPASLEIDTHHENLLKTSVRNDSLKTKFKRKTRKFLTLNVICSIKVK